MVQEGDRWLLETWIRCLRNALEALTGEAPQVTVSESGEQGPEKPAAEFRWWKQPLSYPDGAAIWAGTPEEVSLSLANRVLAAAGVEEVGPDEARSTYHELVQQAMAAMAAAVGAKLGKEVACVGGEEVEWGWPEGGSELRVEFPGEAPFPLRVAYDWALGEAAPGLPAVSEGKKSPSQAIDLLLDVELPVSISFGRTHLPLKEVLKLTSGSIVELDRPVADPVEVVINNCVIARGEVVVVEGNYGVRIHQIVSRQQRLRTLN